MKKEKMSLNELKVKSFVTSFQDGKVDTVKGGAFSDGYYSCIPYCTPDLSEGPGC